MVNHRKHSLEVWRRIISLCQQIEQQGINPFEVEIKDVLRVIKEYLPNLKTFEDLCLDAETINSLSKVVKLQDGWIKYRASSLYSDPDLIEAKLTMLSVEALSKIFLKAWHPIIKGDKLSAKRLKEAVEYWKNKPVEQLESFQPSEAEIYFTSKNALGELNLLTEKEFSEILDEFVAEFSARTGGNKEISYWDFIYADEYSKFILRAYLTSFLVNHGYAELKINPLEEDKTVLKPRLKHVKSKFSTSAVMPLNYSKWLKLKRKSKD